MQGGLGELEGAGEIGGGKLKPDDGGGGCFFFSRRRRHTRFKCDWSSDVCSSDLVFKHALTREVAYGALPKAERARRHAAYADWLQGEDASDGVAGKLAYHYAEAVEPAIADLAWRDRDQDAARLRASALRWVRRAAELALARFDLDDAL